MKKEKDTVEELLMEIENIPIIKEKRECLKVHSPMIHEHDKNVSIRVMKMAILANKSLEEVRELGIAGLLLDIGYIGIPKCYIMKNKYLSHEEFLHVKKHVHDSVGMLKQMNMSPRIISLVKTHHERLNGYGYPEGIDLKNCPFENILVALADAFEAMTEKRPYRESYEPWKALQMIYSLEDEEFTREAISCLTQSVTGCI